MPAGCFLAGVRTKEKEPDMKVYWTDPYTKRTYEFKNLRETTSHGYGCAICRGLIDRCHDTAIVVEMSRFLSHPDKTQPPTQFELVA